LVLLFIIITAIAFILIILLKQINLIEIELDYSEEKLSNADISEPRFAINNETKKIYITASEGNFLNKDEILLRENVRFKSNDFSIETESVIFDRNKQTAQSKTKSLFKSEKTTIYSDGFDIYDKGNKIIFYGKSNIVLK
tara:strand:+ start:1063 stop:1482 length:420 start_codon:yes stop_codon:yes gene_type:complete